MNTIWVKELGGVLDLEKARGYIRKSVIKKKYVDAKYVSEDDIIMVSIKDSDIPDKNRYYVLIFEECADRILKNVIGDILQNYDEYYYRMSLQAAKNPNVDTLLVGSSYGLYGIDSHIMEHTVNCSLPSQDLYYNAKTINEVCNNNTNIKKVVIICGYYFFFSDLSRTENEMEIQRIANVYYPYYGDLHNCVLLPSRRNILFQSELFDLEKISERYVSAYYEEGYFHEGRSREAQALKYWKDENKRWEQITEQEKEAAGKRRADEHNHQINRENTYEQNKMVFKNMLEDCNLKDIKVVFVVTPATKHYRKNFNPHFKEIFYKTLDECNTPIHLLDLFDSPLFENADFNDMDHLNDNGAVKFTTQLLDLLNKI